MSLMVWSFLKKYYRYVIAGLALVIGMVLAYRRKDQYVRIWNRWFAGQAFQERIGAARSEAYLEIRLARKEDETLRARLEQTSSEASEALRRRALIRLANEIRSKND